MALYDKTPIRKVFQFPVTPSHRSGYCREADRAMEVLRLEASELLQYRRPSHVA